MAIELTKTEQTELIDCLLDMGLLLLNCGAEISRVEDTVSRMAKAYGCIRADVFVITSIISLSIEFPDKEVLTDTRRIFSSSETDFTRLEHLNHISRSCCQNPVSVAELHKELRQVASEEKSFTTQLLGSIIGAGAFAVFIGGNLWDGLAAAVFAVGICFLQRKFGKTEVSPAGANLLISLITGIVVGLVGRIIPGIHLDMILIGDIMLLIPGLLRLTESLIWAAALAGGFMLAILIVNVIV